MDFIVINFWNSVSMPKPDTILCSNSLKKVTSQLQNVKIVTNKTQYCIQL